MKDLVVSFIRSADEDAAALPSGHGLQTCGGGPRTVLIEHHTPQKLRSLLALALPSSGLGTSDLSSTVSSILQYSVNTSSPGFLDKLYSSPSPPGIVAELVSSSLNANSHVYTVSPAVTLVEKHVGAELAHLFGLPGPLAGGITVPGGAAANSTALLVARNFRFPELKETGLGGLPRPLAIFISEAAHFSVLNAVQLLGIGTRSVRKVATTVDGAMDPLILEAEIDSAIEQGYIPFFVGATAGTTVRGAYDPLSACGELAHRCGAWFHVDACWGGAAIFSDKLKHKLSGSELADSVAFNPHKMLGVPLTCSFLLARDLRTFWYANRLSAGYLFHGGEELAEADALAPMNGISSDTKRPHTNGVDPTNASWRSSAILSHAPNPEAILDLASLTPQCGRRPDALKLYFHWRYYGKKGMAQQVESAFEVAQYLASLIAKEPDILLVGDLDVPCSQVCFYYSDSQNASFRTSEREEARRNSRVTRMIVSRLVTRGWMVDYAPGTGKEGERGEFLRVVCNRLTSKGIAKGLVRAVIDVGAGVVKEISKQ